MKRSRVLSFVLFVLLFQFQVSLVQSVAAENDFGLDGFTYPDESTDQKDQSESPPVFFMIRLGQGGFSDDRSPLGVLGGGQVTLDVKPESLPIAVSFSSEYYTNSAGPTHSYEIADMFSVNLLYMTSIFSKERVTLFCGGGFGVMEVPKGEKEPDRFINGTLANMEAGMNVRLFWKIGFYGVAKYLYAYRKTDNVKVIDFKESILLLGFTMTFGFDG